MGTPSEVRQMGGKTLKIASVAVVAVVIVAAVAMIPGMTEGERGLYRLDASYVEVSMGRCSASPVVVGTLETIFDAHYGDLPDRTYTHDEVMADTAFAETHCSWEPLVTSNPDGTVTVHSHTSVYGDEDVVMDVADSMVVMSTVFTDTLYYLLCQEHGVEPYSEEGLSHPGLGEDLRSMVAGGLDADYYADQGAEYMEAYGVLDGYLDLGVKSATKVDPEVLTDVMSRASGDGSSAVYLAYGSLIREDKQYRANTDPCRSTGSEYAFMDPQSIPDISACIDAVGRIMGFDEAVITGLIEDVQCDMYAVYRAVQSESDGDRPLVYWEYSSGKSVKTAMGREIMSFMGFDTRLMDGSEYDLEALMLESPDVLCFYDTDPRTMDERMRVY